MNTRDLTAKPRHRRGRHLPALREKAANPFFALQREVNRETDKELKFSAELPGMTDKDIEVLVSGDSLTIRGEKKEEKEEKKEDYYRMERRYGSFRRVLQLPSEVEAENTQATFKNGVLEITISKSE